MKHSFPFLYSPSCIATTSSEYIKWTCTPDKKSLCPEIKKYIIVKMLYFKTVEETTTKGKNIKKLKALPVDANIPYVINFIEQMLPNIIHHRNLLKNYRSNIDVVIESIDHCVQLWLDFSENLTVPVKQEPQSLHWSKEQKTVHSGILKMNGEKQYHPYMSDDLKHDQCFVSNVVENMVAEVNISAEMTLLIVSDNCPGQYKSVQNFFDRQNLCNKHGVRIVRVYGIP